MSYYVSAVSGSRRALVVGPFRRHGDALAHVEPFRRWAAQNVPDARWPDVGVGTARNATGHRVGHLTTAYGVALVDGWARNERELALRIEGGPDA